MAAHRQLNALGLIGSLPAGIPVLASTQFALTYVEQWNGDRVLEEGGTYGLPQQVAVGDGGIAASGIRWGHPTMLDLQLMIMLAQVTQGPLSGSIAGFAGSQAGLTALLLQQRAWIVNPAAGSVYFSPADPTWNAFRDPEDFNFEIVAAAALATSFVPDFPAEFLSPVVVAYPFVTLANTKIGGDATTNLTTDRYLTAFAAQSKDNAVSLFDYPREQLFLLDSTETGQIVQPRIADNGTVIYEQGSDLLVTDFQLGGAKAISGFTTIGQNPSIADNGLIVFAAEHPTLGRGIFVYDPQQDTWAKIAGEAEDGVLDPNETFVDVNGNGKFDPDIETDVGGLRDIQLDGQVGLNGMARELDGQAAPPSLPFLTASFLATNGDDVLGLHAVSFFSGEFQNDELNNSLFIGHNRVINIGEKLPRLGTVQQIELNDPINDSGQIVFWALTDQGEAIVRANPPLNSFGQVLYTFENQKLSENKNADLKRDDGVLLARFMSSDPDANETQFKAMIDWGDGQQELGVVKQNTTLKSPDGQINKLLFEVIGDHTYQRQGPYVITIQIQDTKSRVGNIATSLAYAVDTTSEENLERFVENDPDTIVTSAVTSNPYGLPTFVRIDPDGSFQATTTGVYDYAYLFKLDTAGSGGDGQPSETRKAGSSQDANKEVLVQSIVATGSLDRTTFDVASFHLNTYQVAFDGQGTIEDSRTVAELDEQYTESVRVDTQFHEVKSYDGGLFTWTYDTVDDYSLYQREGVQTIDRQMIDQADALVQQSAADLAAKLVTQPLAGDYTLTRDGMHVTEQITETGDYNVRMVTSRLRDATTTATETISGSNGPFLYHRTQQIAIMNTTSSGTVDLDTGEYHVQFTATVDNVIQSYTEDNQTMHADITGTTQVTTQSDKTGSDQTGEFSLMTQTIVDMDQTAHRVESDSSRHTDQHQHHPKNANDNG